MPRDAVSSALLFGKLPAHGDFVARGLDGVRRDRIDRWLAASLDDARAALGSAFDRRYDAAPSWRFAGRDEHGLAAAALAPSVDSAGRRFPIYVAIERIEAGSAADAAEICETLIYRALEEEWDADRLLAETAAAAPGGDAEPSCAARWWTLGGEHFAPAELPGDLPGNLLRVALAAEAEP